MNMQLLYLFNITIICVPRRNNINQALLKKENIDKSNQRNSRLNKYSSTIQFPKTSSTKEKLRKLRDQLTKFFLKEHNVYSMKDMSEEEESKPDEKKISKKIEKKIKLQRLATQKTGIYLHDSEKNEDHEYSTNEIIIIAIIGIVLFIVLILLFYLIC